MAKHAQLVLGYSDFAPQAERLARELNIGTGIIDVHRFPDGESKVTVPEVLPKHIIICRSLNNPNDKLIELMLTCNTVRELGVEDITLVAPYLCYMRQDIAFRPGEAVSQKIVGKFLANQIEALVTVDAHLHRIESLQQAIPVKKALNLSAAELIGDFISKNFANPLLLGPDEESKQWVKTAANVGKYTFGVATKYRYGDHKVRVSLPDLDISGRDVVIVDDMASTGQTLMEAAKQLREKQASSISCVVTHALFYTEVMQQMHKAGITNVWSTDSVSHASNAINLANIIAVAVAS